MALDIRIQNGIGDKGNAIITVKLTGSLDTATAPQLAEQLAPVLARTRECVDSVLAHACLTTGEVDAVIRTGGTSEIIAVRALLESLFPGKVEGHDPFTSVASGRGEPALS